MAQLILCWQQQSQCKVGTLAKKIIIICLNMVITDTDISTNQLRFLSNQPCQKVSTFLKRILFCLVFPAVLWHSYFPIFKTQGRNPLTFTIPVSVELSFPFHKSLLREIFDSLNSLDVSLWRKDIIYRHIRATMTRSGPQSTSYTM